MQSRLSKASFASRAALSLWPAAQKTPPGWSEGSAPHKNQ